MIFILVSLIGVFSFFSISNHKINKKIEDYKAKTNEILVKSKHIESELDSKKQSLNNLKEKNSELYKEYELWQKMNQNILDQM